MSRLDKLKEQHPELNVSLIDIIASVEPSETYKYMGFLIKMLKNEYYKKGDVTGMHRGIMIKLFEYENLSLLIDFEKHSRANRLSNPDIGQYRSFKEIEKEVKRADEVVKLKELEKQVKKLYETDFWLVIIPLSYEASKMYGANTKWCTTQEKYWNDYKTKYKLIYIINKKTDVKYAVSSATNEDKVQGWLANDKESNPMLWSIPNDVMNVLVEEVRKKESVVELAMNNGITSAIQESKKEKLSPLSSFIEPYLRGYGDDNDDNDERAYRTWVDAAHEQDVRNIASTMDLNTPLDINRITDIMRRLDGSSYFGGGSPDTNLPF